MNASEKAAYLKGLMEGMDLDTSSGEGKLFAVIADVLETLTRSVAEQEENALDLAEEIDQLSDDLAGVEKLVYGQAAPGCGRCCPPAEDGEDEEDEEEPVFFEVTCPACEKTITVDEDVLALGSIQCPHCGEMMEFDPDGEDDGSNEDE